MATNTCKTCKYYYTLYYLQCDLRIPSRAECRRFPPTSISFPAHITNIVYTTWPRIRENDFCGEWKQGEPNEPLCSGIVTTMSEEDCRNFRAKYAPD